MNPTPEQLAQLERVALSGDARAISALESMADLSRQAKTILSRLSGGEARKGAVNRAVPLSPRRGSSQGTNRKAPLEKPNQASSPSPFEDLATYLWSFETEPKYHLERELQPDVVSDFRDEGWFVSEGPQGSDGNGRVYITKGETDLDVTRCGINARIELKVKDRKPTPGQLEWHALARAAGLRVFVIRSREAARLIRAILWAGLEE